METQRKLVVVDIAALGWDFTSAHPQCSAAHGFAFQRAETVFPALTCTVQASFRTAAHPCFHGMVANGFYARRLARPFFWEQSSDLVFGRRIWSDVRRRGGRVGMLFWQQSLGEHADLILTPKPVHKHHGGMIPDCLSVPSDLYGNLRQRLGREFPLHRYWGPLAGEDSSRWITEAACEMLADPDSVPELLMVYLPHLDYALQRHGSADPRSAVALDEALAMLASIRDAARAAGAELLAFGDYAIAPVTAPPVFPARRFLETGLFRTQKVKGRLYPDYPNSRAVALVDHEIALVYARDEQAAREARAAMESLDGVDRILDAEGQRNAGVDEPQGPDFILVAAEGRWFAYPWWESPRTAPDFANHVDIHSKPGFDPCELFSGFPPTRITSDPNRVRGTHGRAGSSRAIAWTSTFELPGEPDDLLHLSKSAEDYLEGR